MLNTQNEEYVQMLIDHAIAQRTSPGATNLEDQVVEIAEDWLQQLQEVPFISKRPGKTIHLIKKASKPVPQERKRRKISLMGTLQEFKAYQAASVEGDVDMERVQASFKDITDQLKRKDKPQEQEEQP